MKKIWYLSNVKNENGPFQYIKNSNQYKYNKLNKNGDRYRFIENDIDKSQIVTVTGQIGTKTPRTRIPNIYLRRRQRTPWSLERPRIYSYRQNRKYKENCRSR